MTTMTEPLPDGEPTDPAAMAGAPAAAGVAEPARDRGAARAVRGATPAPRAVRRLILVSAAAAVVAAALYVGTITTRTGQLLGELMLGGRPASPIVVASAEQLLASLSRSSLVLGVAVVVGIALLQRRRFLAIAALATIAAANVTTQLLKLLVLDRADLLDGLFYPLPNSFPSGHATAASSIAVGLLLVLPPLLRAPTVVLSSIVVALVGIATLVAGWHRMADAVGGVYVATAWAAGIAALLAWRRGIEVAGPRTAAFGRVTASIPLLVGALLLGLGGLAYVVVALDPLGVLLVLAERGGSPALFAIGTLLTVGTSLLGLGALGFALRDIQLDPHEAPPR